MVLAGPVDLVRRPADRRRVVPVVLPRHRQFVRGTAAFVGWVIWAVVRCDSLKKCVTCSKNWSLAQIHQHCL